MRLPLAKLEIFDAIVRAGNLRGAATTLGLKPSTVSYQLKELEQQVGSALFIRTTRSISLTEAGRALAKSTGPALDQLTDGMESARTVSHAARGTLKLAIPDLAYQLLVRNSLASFKEQYPEIEVEISMTDALSDILSEGLHAGFRLGGMVAQDMISVPLTAPLETVVAASPEYLATHGRPVEPSDLLNHNCLRYRFPSSGNIGPWTFSGPDGAYQVDIKGGVITDSSTVNIELAVQGLGLTFTFRGYCKEPLENGSLEEVLTEHLITVPAINVYFPREYREMLPLRLFINHLKQYRSK
ncbi:MAG: LysR family transcriptional regulator [Pseudomonadota bacterium]